MDLLHKTLSPLAPGRLTSITLTRGNSGVEKAVYAAIAERGLGDASRSKSMCAVGFEGSVHGSASSLFSRQLSGVKGLPSFNWPTVSYPTS